MDPNIYALVLDTLNRATSQDAEVLKPAEKKLQEWQVEPGFYSVLLDILANHSININIRWLAVMCFKNGVDRYWRKNAPNAISDEEKEKLKLGLLTPNILSEPVVQIATQQAVLISKIARFDCPLNWQNLVPDLMNALKAPQPLVQHRSLLIFHHVVKALASKRLPCDRKTFQELTATVYSYILNLWHENTELFLRHIQESSTTELINEHLEKALLCLRILRKLTVCGFPNKRAHENADVVAFLNVIFDRAKTSLECRKLLKGRGIYTLELCEKFIVHLTKVALGVLSNHPLSYVFLIKPSLEFTFYFCFTEQGMVLSYERFTIQCLNILKGILQCVEYKHSRALGPSDKDPLVIEAREIKKAVLDENTVCHMCRHLVSHYFLLSSDDLSLWDSEPESFATDEAGESWKYSLRPCTEATFMELFHEHRGVLVPELVRMLAALQQTPILPDDLNGILKKDAVYNAIGLAAFDLYDEIDFDEWFTNILSQELKVQDDNYRIIRRRVCQLIGQWSGVRVSESLRPAMYTALLEPLTRATEDVAVKLAAAEAIRSMIDDFNFDAEVFSPYASHVLAALYDLLVRSDECDTKMHVLHVVSYVIQRCGGEAMVDGGGSDRVAPLLAYLPQLWAHAETHQMLRAAVLAAAVNMIKVKRYRVEIYVSCGSIRYSEWELRYKASPGSLEQLEDFIEGGLGTAQHASCLMAVCIKGGRQIGVACISTADFTLSVSEFTDDELLTQLETVTVQMSPHECVVANAENDEYKSLKKVMERANVTVTNLKKSDFSTEGLIQDLNRLLKFKESQQKDANVFIETRMEMAMSSVAAAVKYMSLMTDQSHFGRYRLETIQTETFLHVDASAMAALNVFPEAGDNSGAPSRSLYGLLDRCRTQHGKRLLAQWLRQPLRDINLINERLDIVEALVNKSQVRLQLYEEHLRKLPDLQALARRLTRKKANLHDCYRIYQALKRLPQLLQCMSESESTSIHSALTEPIAELASDLDKFQQMIESTLDLDAVDRGDYLVKPSFDENLSSASETLEELRDSAQTELNKAARDLGLDAGKTIKLEVNTQTGFFFRVTLKEEQNLRKKKNYIIVDAVKGGVRFKTTKLDRINENYVQTMKVYELEQEKVVGEIVAIAAGYSDCLLCLSHLLSRVDVLVAFSMAAVNAPEAYVRPEIVESLDVFILEGARHPCLEIMEGVSYIANDVKFERGKCLLQIVTGPNMGGKSTWMRSAGVSTLLAHVGSFVPCVRAVIPRLKAICARVGAADNEQCAQSTFMREMLDTAAILRIATPDSLVLIDELGRGTSTYEGCGLAWAIAEELATKTQSFTLFATHYHELTRLSSLHPARIVNRHAAATCRAGALVLCRRIEPGASANSLGLELARAANLPEKLLKYAEEKQAELETNLFGTENENTSEGQQILVDFISKCKEIEATTTSDKEVMTKIQDLKNELFKMDNKYVKAFMV